MTNPKPEHLAGQSTAIQHVLDLILDECRYWQGRDEARRGGYAILYAKAKKVADKAATQAEPVAHVSEETFSSDGTSDIITCNLPIGAKLYTYPPSDPSTVPVRRELLESVIDLIEHDTHYPFGEPQTPNDAIKRAITDALRALLAQSEGAKP